VNPEFRRNLWLQLSWPKIVLTPVLIGTVFAVLGSTLGLPFVHLAAGYGFWLAAVLWGTRRAADSIAEEASGATWHSQRMSSLDAWAMTWGKLLGATAFPWYVALICLVVQQGTWTLVGTGVCGPAFFGRMAPTMDAAACLAGYERLWAAPVWMIVIALSAQATALAVVLAALRRQPLALRLPVTLAQAVAILLLAALSQLYLPLSGTGATVTLGLDGVRSLAQRPIHWYGTRVDPLLFSHAALTLLLGVTLFAAYRLMRVVLQYRSWPWGVAAGTATLAVLVAGFPPVLSRPDEAWRFAPDALLAVTWVAVYAGLFTDRIDFARLPRLARAAMGGEFARALRQSPSWLAAYVLALLAGIGVAIVAPGEQTIHLPGTPSMMQSLRFEPPVPAIASQLLYILRDIALVLWLHMLLGPRRADLAAAVTLGVLYLLVPFVADAAGLSDLILRLRAGFGPGAAVAIAGLQAAVACGLFLLRWRALPARPAGEESQRSHM